MKNDAYYFHQTPELLCKELIKHIPDLSSSDVVFEPFAGEGAWVRSFPVSQNMITTELEYGTDYTTIDLEKITVDWVITNPPFCLDVFGKTKRENAIPKLANYFAGKTKKGFALLINEQGFASLTPPRLKILYETKGVYLYKMVVCNVKKWRGRYYFVIFKNKQKPKPCCNGCKDNKPCEGKTEAHDHAHDHEKPTELKPERFDFLDYIEGSF